VDTSVSVRDLRLGAQHGVNVGTYHDKRACRARFHFAAGGVLKASGSIRAGRDC
jgi:hypothetical protein